MISRRVRAVVTCSVLTAGVMALVWHAADLRRSAPQVDFNRDIRPILNQNCASCHGGVRQLGNVSFVYREEALGKGKSGRATIVPGNARLSELFARVTSRDPAVRMPYHASPLQPKQIELLKQWINEGAAWEDHWAFVAPKPQALPGVHNVRWVRQPLDRFVLARLEKEGLSPSSEASKEELLRRVSFDLTGLPPTREELAGFLADTSADAYERQVDRLLASPHYGERWAAMWLDLARYADSKGYEKDLNRTVWPYRDWVINAYNRNLPYDRFVITQLAGDLLPNPTLDDRIATSFQRQTPANDEGGTDDEEFRLVAVMDRAATTWSVLNGLTMNCVQCHSHPYDPIRHVEYYKFLAFYNTSRDADLGDDAPNLPVPRELALHQDAGQLEERQAQLLEEIVAEGRGLAAQTSWAPLPVATGDVDHILGLERALQEAKEKRAKGANPFPNLSPQEAQEQYAEITHDLREARQTPTPPIALKVGHGEVEAVGTIPSNSMYEIETGSQPATITALRIEEPPGDPIKARSTPEGASMVSRVEAWVISPAHGPQRITFRYFVPDSEEDLKDRDDHERVAGALVSGPTSAQSLGRFAGDGRFATDTTKLFQSRWVIAIPEQPLHPEPGSHLKIQITNAGGNALRHISLETSEDARWGEYANSERLKSKLAELSDVTRHLAAIPTVTLPVMQEQPVLAQRQTLEFDRGNFLTKVGTPLAPDTPALFPKLPREAARNRLAMARWFFAPAQPLTARVAVNRYWEQLFGTGIVETLEDFGSAGQSPSHPELLDWLALHFQNDLRWDMKALLRELVTSSTYRQSAVVTSALLEKDPRNRLLARGPQQRLAAEMVRDQALLASGLLSPTIGGPSVMPPQPPGIWASVYNDSKWIDATGPDRYRRAIYTFIKRSAIYPSFVTFDAAPHDVSVARRIPTDTPLQALVTLNDPVYSEAAAVLAQRMLAIGPSGSAPLHAGAGSFNGDAVLDKRLSYAARGLLSRDLSNQERTTLHALYGRLRAESPRSPSVGLRSRKDRELIVYTSIASVLMNLDAALTR